MKYFHIADLHLGKKINERSMHDDQEWILNQIVTQAKTHQVDGVIIAGDIYDRSIPPVESVKLFEHFLESLKGVVDAIYIIAGNHDSQERLSFGSTFFKKENIYISGLYEGSLVKVDAKDDVTIYLLPFIRPHMVRQYFTQEISNYHQAVDAILNQEILDSSRFNILVAHQFIVSGTQEPLRSDSETISVGGVDSVDASVFDAFDYVALGHIHRPQSIQRKTIRYAGSPLVYSQSEVNQEKSITLLEIMDKTLTQETIPLVPIRPVKVIKGHFSDIVQSEYTLDYVYLELEDTQEITDASMRLRQVFPNVLSIRYLYTQSLTSSSETLEISRVEDLSMASLFDAFYQTQNNHEMSGEQKKLIDSLIEQGDAHATN
ncbi:hypothetical protein AOC36_03510 [Erysipelothrix larvae]|uniref:Nuclease SbcCD subunit D n=1 Tax=Erysipelothrix larvae TaxID=1514105 RepID=A0A109UGT3_9FIRM|nr:exonuclease SbcCD subunit D [Erysipelothrix larvae]AMC93076.1 hypothetical protein AOC36_03510 [Erysipelothrix larvae]